MATLDGFEAGAFCRGHKGYSPLMPHGVRGLANQEITPETASRLAGHWASRVPGGSRLAIGGDGHHFVEILKRSLLSGLMAAGVFPVDLGITTGAVTRFGVRVLQTEGGVHLRLEEGKEGTVICFDFYDREGYPVAEEEEQALQSSLSLPPPPWAGLDSLGKMEYRPEIKNAYIQQILKSVDMDAIRRRRFRLALEYHAKNLDQLLPPLLEKLGCSVYYIPAEEGEEKEKELGVLLQKEWFDLAIRICPHGERWVLYSERGREIKGLELLALRTFAGLARRQERTLPVPDQLALSLESMLGEGDGRLQGLEEAKGGELAFHPLTDGLSSLIQLLEFLAVQGGTLDGWKKHLPAPLPEDRS